MLKNTFNLNFSTEAKCYDFNFVRKDLMSKLDHL